MASASSEQHKDLRAATQIRDTTDLNTFIQWLDAHPPFAQHESGLLVSIATGIISDSSVN